MAHDERRLEVLRAIVAGLRRRPTSRSAARPWPTGTTSASRRRPSATTWRCSRSEGYIAQPHTSAGRVPTDKGYRLFVDRLSAVKPLSAAERRAIETFLDGAVDLRRRAAAAPCGCWPSSPARSPSCSTRRCRARASATSRSSQLAAARLMLVLITDTGRVEQRVVELPGRGRRRRRAPSCARCSTPRSPAPRWPTPAAIVPDLLDDRARRTCAALVGDASAPMLLETLVEPQRGPDGLGGTANLDRGNALDFPGTIRPVLEALEEQVVLLRLLSEVDAEHGAGPDRRGERRTRRSAGASVVSRRLRRARTARSGGLGVLGPTRMDYPAQHGRGARRGPLRRPDPAGRGAEATTRRTLVTGDATTTACSACARDATRRGDQAGLPQAGPRAAPGRQPRPGGAGAVQGGHRAPTRCCPTRRSGGSSTSAATRSTPAPARAAGSPFGAGFGGLGDIMDAFFGGAATAARPAQPHPRRAPTRCCGSSSTLDEAAFGVDARTSPSTPPSSAPTCSGAGTRARHAPGAPATTCAGRGEVQSVQRSLPRPGHDQPGLPDLRAAPASSSPTRARRAPATGGCAPAARSRSKVPGRRRGRHADPAVRPGRGRPRRRPGRRPVRRDPRAAARRVHPRRRGPALHGHAADDRRRARHRRSSSTTLDGEEELDIRPGTQSGSVLTLRAQGRAAAARHRPRRPARARRGARRRPGWTPSRSSCCASSPRCAARTSPSRTARRRAGCSPGSATRSTGADR